MKERAGKRILIVEDDLHIAEGIRLNLTLKGHEVMIAADGSYTCAVTLEGGSGRATVESPAALTVADGILTATIVWSSPNYEYMLVDDVQYDPIQTEGNSEFQIPVTLDEDVAVSALTVAMSQPHLIDYTLHFDSVTLSEVTK